MKTILPTTLVAIASILHWTGAGAQENEPVAPKPSLQALATQADLIALVQVRDTDYVYAREYPTGGTAFLGVLIPYKLTEPVSDIVEVYEEGLRAGECYFDNPTVYEEGRRHLLFARFNPDVENQYLGLPAGCALEVLVTAGNDYALRYPLNGITVSDDLSTLARAMEFQDSYAYLDDDALTVDERNALLERGLLEELEDGRFRYTHGIALSELRPLLGEENLTLDRALRREEPEEP